MAQAFENLLCGQQPSAVRIAYLFTTFPVLSETFLQREIRAMRELPVQMDIYSLHGGQDEFEGLRVQRFRKRELVALLWKLPPHFFRRKDALRPILRTLLTKRPPSFTNFCETLLGLAFAILYEKHFRHTPPDLFHAVWATMPATAALLLREYTGVPYSMGAHAYDIYRHGGDWLLDQKLLTSRMIHTTTEAARQELIARGATEHKLELIRRGLDVIPEIKADHLPQGPLRILAVGRLVEKKGYFEQLELYRYLHEHGFAFEARIVGGGKLKTSLRARKHALQLESHVLMLGRQNYAGVADQYAWADVVIFTGKIAPDGDRDGLPNVIPEAMAAGVPVIATPVSGVPEAIMHEQTGLLVALDDFEGWRQALIRLRDEASLRKRLRNKARQWAETHFCAHRNAAALAQQLRACAGIDPDGTRNPWIAASPRLRDL